jgi:hypothetical protein
MIRIIFGFCVGIYISQNYDIPKIKPYIDSFIDELEKRKNK